MKGLEYDERADSRTLRYKAYCITGQAPNCNACLDGTLRARAPLTSVQSRRTVVERTSLQRVAATYTMPRTRMQPPLHLLAHLVLLLCACSAAAARHAAERGATYESRRAVCKVDAREASGARRRCASR